MCPPAVIAAVALGTAQAGMQIAGQRQAAKTQERMQANATKLEQQRYLNQVSAMRMQQAQEAVGKAQRIQQSTRKAREARATALVSAGEAGVAGLSVDGLMNELTRQEAQYRFSETKNEEMTDVNRELQLNNVALGSEMNLLRINKPIEQPNYLGAILSGAQTGMSMYSMGSGDGGMNKQLNEFFG